MCVAHLIVVKAEVRVRNSCQWTHCGPCQWLTCKVHGDKLYSMGVSAFVCRSVCSMQVTLIATIGPSCGCLLRPITSKICSTQAANLNEVRNTGLWLGETWRSRNRKFANSAKWNSTRDCACQKTKAPWGPPQQLTQWVMHWRYSLPRCTFLFLSIRSWLSWTSDSVSLKRALINNSRSTVAASKFCPRCCGGPKVNWSSASQPSFAAQPVDPLIVERAKPHWKMLAQHYSAHHCKARSLFAKPDQAHTVSEDRTSTQLVIQPVTVTVTSYDHDDDIQAGSLHKACFWASFPVPFWYSQRMCMFFHWFILPAGRNPRHHENSRVSFPPKGWARNISRISTETEETERACKFLHIWDSTANSCLPTNSWLRSMRFMREHGILIGLVAKCKHMECGYSKKLPSWCPNLDACCNIKGDWWLMKIQWNPVHLFLKMSLYLSIDPTRDALLWHETLWTLKNVLHVHCNINPPPVAEGIVSQNTAPQHSVYTVYLKTLKCIFLSTMPSWQIEMSRATWLAHRMNFDVTHVRQIQQALSWQGCTSQARSYKMIWLASMILLHAF